MLIVLLQLHLIELCTKLTLDNHLFTGNGVPLVLLGLSELSLLLVSLLVQLRHAALNLTDANLKFALSHFFHTDKYLS